MDIVSHEHIEIPTAFSIRVRFSTLLGLDPEPIAPRYSHSGDAGADIRAQQDVDIDRGATAKIPTGLCFEIPAGYEGQVRTRSGMASKGLVAVQGTIDHGYTGEVFVLLHNTSREMQFVRVGDRIAQVVVSPIVRAVFRHVPHASLTHSERGPNGFGSSGIS